MVKINANLKNKKTGDIIIPNTTTANVADVAKNQALSATLVNTPDKSTLGYPAFSTVTNYAIEDKVYYSNKLYKFKAAHSAGVWNDAHVDEMSIKEDLKNYSDTKISKVSNPTINNIPIINDNGELIDSNIGIDKIAHIDGFYEGMGVGVAKRLEGNTDVAGSFLERTTGGDAELANGLAQLNEVQGGSVKFNQLVKNGNFADTSNWNSNEGTISASDNILTYTITKISSAIYSQSTNQSIPYVKGHKYYFSVDVKTSLSQVFLGGVIQKASDKANVQSVTPNQWTRFNAIAAPTEEATTSSMYVSLSDSQRVIGDTMQLRNYYCIDLTAIFGAGNEPTTVEEFEEWLAENVGVKDYYEYTDGEVVNNNMTGIESTGFNLFNPTTGKARIIGAYSDVYGNYYGIRGTHGTLTFEDDLGNVSTVTPDADGKAELDVSGYISVADAGNDVAVFLWWDGKKTEYEDYDVEIAHLDVKHIYGKKNGAGELVQVWPTGMPRINDVVDKLCIENGAVVAKRNIGEVNMGSLIYSYNGNNGGIFLADDNNIKLINNSSAVQNILCSKYHTYPAGIFNNNSYIDKAITLWGAELSRTIRVRDTSFGTDVASFKTAMNGVLLYYELATPETYTDLVYMGSEYFADGTPVALPVNYKVNNWGVESILPKNTSTILTAKPTVKVRYAIDAVEQLNTHSDEIDSLHDDIDELDGAKANTVGVYDDMVVGAAKAIAGNQRLDKEFTSMIVEGADGVAKINEVRGKSLVWNQLIKVRSSSISKTENGVTFTDNMDGSYSVSTDSQGATADVYLHVSTEFILGHKYLVKGCPSGGTASTYFLNMSSGTIETGSGLILTNTKLDGLVFYPRIQVKQGTIITTPVIFHPQIFDLTKMFGAGNEPATVAEFEALFPDAYYDYNDGEIINNATEELDIYDSEETLKSTLPLNLTTITGKQVGVEDAESVVIFPDGMRQAGSVADTLLVDDDGYARRALVKIGSRAYQSDDESDSNVVTDLTNTLYALETASEYILDEPILMTFKAYHGGTIVQSPQAPDSAPMSMNVTFALDAVATLNNLPQNYISADSMDAFLAQLGAAMNGTWTKSWDAANNRYGFTFTPNTEGE